MKGDADDLVKPVLPSFLKAWIQVCTDDSLIQFGTTDVLHAVQCILVVIVFYEAKPARGLVEAVKSHDQPLYLTTPEVISRL